MIIVITGSRDLVDTSPIEQALLHAVADSCAILYHGAANGADALAGHYARSRGWAVREFPANWDAYRIDAGPMRNAEMLVAAKKHASKLNWPIVLFAFPAPSSRGTRNCIALAKLLKVPTTVIEVKL